MVAYTIFPRAPITEALLDIRVELNKSFPLSDLEQLHQKIKDRFPDKQQRIAFQTNIKLAPSGPTAEIPSSQPDGYLFRSSATNKILQARLDGFTFNKLKPYQNWQVFKSEAQELWDLYYQCTKPLKITRLALRYINRIDLPVPFNTFKDYILTLPEVAPELPQALAGFFMQLTIPNSEKEATAVVNETIENVTGSQKLPLIFDIDVFREVSFMNNRADIWPIFDQLRDFKNDIFFSSITEKTKELFT
ncbi:MAG: TIGR04255 family protein [Nitrospirota bacterium]